MSEVVEGSRVRGEVKADRRGLGAILIHVHGEKHHNNINKSNKVTDTT